MCLNYFDCLFFRSGRLESGTRQIHMWPFLPATLRRIPVGRCTSIFTTMSSVNTWRISKKWKQTSSLFHGVFTDIAQMSNTVIHTFNKPSEVIHVRFSKIRKHINIKIIAAVFITIITVRQTVVYSSLYKYFSSFSDAI